MNFYISDTHFGHQNIIRYDNRPFSTVEEMDRTLIERWNNIVSDKDMVYILGDFSWYNEKKTIEILDRLCGHKILVKGNHDRVSPKIAKIFGVVCDYIEITDGKEKVVMSHYPTPFWNGQFNDTVHLYGHVHNSRQWNNCENLRKSLKEQYNIPMRMINVGCMMEWMNYAPQPLGVILEREAGFRGV